MTTVKRLKTLVVSAATALCLCTGPLLAQGTTPLSYAQQFDVTGAPLAGCLLYFFQAGTIATPQNSYSDFGLTAVQPNPLQCDQSGRVPLHWLANGLIHIRLTDATGVVQIDNTMQVLGPSSGGGGGGGTVDPTTILATGDVKARYGTGALSGFVRANGLTIGNATCGCTERANADTQNLFVYLYNADPNLAVSGGRTGNALNDFNSNKQLSLPDWRGQAIGALADMGNSPTSLLTSTYFGTSPTVLGAAGGLQSNTIGQANLPAVNLTVNDTRTWGSNNTGTVTTNIATSGGPYGAVTVPGSPSFTVNVVPTSGSVSAALGGSGSLFPTVGPMKLLTVYVKL